MKPPDPIRVLYSFPHKLGGGRIQTTAWEQVKGLINAGADVLVCPGFVKVSLPGNPTVVPTLSRGKLRLPYKLFGALRTSVLHDRIVAHRLERLADKVDIVHTWPLGAKKTLQVAARLGIPTVLERPNAHTRFAYEVVAKECRRIGVTLPPGHEHAYNAERLKREEEEYELAGSLLCPSDFVVRTFADEGFPAEKLRRHFYGVNDQIYHPESSNPRNPEGPFTVLFVGVCAVRKGLHFALEAWLKSPASKDGQLLIAGDFIPSYEQKLRPMLSHPSVRVLGHRDDIPELMRRSDVLVLPSLEEGSALVTAEARSSGCVLLVSDASGAICEHAQNGLIHSAGDVETLMRHITMLYEDPSMRERLRSASLSTIVQITWTAAGVKLLDTYREAIAAHRRDRELMAPRASFATK
jgi:glycosyltransferase involved in cell wall biosynthesis